MDEAYDVNPHASGTVLADLAREVVRVHARFYGRGPTKAKAVWRRGVVTVILEEIFTPAEQLLVEAGDFEVVRRQRQAFQDEVEPLLRQTIEQITGCRVKSFLSQVSFDGVASEVFILDESSEPGPGPVEDES
jgi:uncharacterized protein YbcI